MCVLSVRRPQASEAQGSYVSLSDTCLLSAGTEPRPPGFRRRLPSACAHRACLSAPLANPAGVLSMYRSPGRARGPLGWPSLRPPHLRGAGVRGDPAFFTALSLALCPRVRRCGAWLATVTTTGPSHVAPAFSGASQGASSFSRLSPDVLPAWETHPGRDSVPPRAVGGPVPRGRPPRSCDEC